MLRHIKYEYRKNLVLYIILLAILFGTQLVAVAAILSRDEIFMIFAMMIFISGVSALVVFFMILSIITYSRELGSKGSYMAFMTPQSTYEIIGAKYLTMLITTVVVSLAIVGFSILDLSLLVHQFVDVDIQSLLDAIVFLFRMQGYSNPFVLLLSTILLIWLFIVSMVCVIFFSISLSHTILENKKGKGGLSVAFIVTITGLLILAMRNIPSMNYGFGYDTVLINSWPHILLMIVVSGGSFVGSATLMDKKLSL